MAVQLKINQHQLVKNLQHAFAGRATFLAELMQNARRAGATYVAFSYDEEAQTLTVEDDGCGIKDPQVLFSVADSGWANEVKDTEHPYGLGFLSALYQSDRVEITSLGQRIAFRTEDALGFEKIPVEACEMERITRIDLAGVPQLPMGYRYYIGIYAQGFPIPVYWGDEALPRPDAIDAEERDFFPTRFGAMSLAQWPEDGNIEGRQGTKHTRLYLQGICVQKVSPFGGYNIVHLDPRQFMGRMPDRDRLINHDEVVKEVRALVERLWHQRLHELLEVTPAEVVARHWYTTLQYWQCLELLDTVPYLPVGVCEYCNNYPILTQEWESVHRNVRDLISREGIESGKVQIVRETDRYRDEGSGWQTALYLYETEAKQLKGELAPTHWVQEHVLDIEPSDVRLHIDAYKETQWDGAWTYAPVWFTDRVSLEGPLGRVTTQWAFVACDVEVICGDEPQRLQEQVIVVPAAENGGEVVRQLSYFNNEYENFDEQEAEKEAQRFINFLLSERAGNATGLIQRLLSQVGTSQYDVLRNKTFRVRFDEHGKATVKAGETI